MIMNYAQWKEEVLQVQKEFAKSSPISYGGCRVAGCRDTEYEPCTHNTMEHNFNHDSLERKYRDLIAMQNNFCSNCSNYLQPGWVSCPYCSTPSPPKHNRKAHANCKPDLKKTYCGDCGEKILNI